VSKAIDPLIRLEGRIVLPSSTDSARTTGGFSAVPPKAFKPAQPRLQHKRVTLPASLPPPPLRAAEFSAGSPLLASLLANPGARGDRWGIDGPLDQ
jgi:hypothetical protein